MRGRGNINFVLIGAKATGKTVYLASLFLNEKSITSEDGHTIEYMKPLANSLLEGEYPQATAGSLHELKFNYKGEDISCHLQIDDVDGYFVETMHQQDEATQKQRDTLLKNIKNSEGIIFFFPYEKDFNEESIKNFNYEIDTIISKLTEMYNKYDYIPIPAVIAVSKWDKSPYFKYTDENEKVLEYINNNKFLKLAKEKIEHNFQNLKIIPISAIGKDIHNMEPYNLLKPIQFFIKETYKLWEKKIDSLKEDKHKLLVFLAKVQFDMKFYKNGKYNKMYDELEREYAAELFSELNNIKNYKKFEIFENKNRDIIKSLSPKNRERIESRGEKLKFKEKVKKVSFGTIATIALVVIVIVMVGWYTKTKLLRTEAELYSDISTEYKNSNYKNAMEDIAEYQEKFQDTLNSDHKNSVAKMKNTIISAYNTRYENIIKNTSLIKQHEQLKNLYSEIEDFGSVMDTIAIKNRYEKISELYDAYNQLLEFSPDDISSPGEIGTKFKELSAYRFEEIPKLRSEIEKSINSMANNLASEQEIEDTAKIDDLLKIYAILNIDNPDMKQKLVNIKNITQIQKKFNEIKNIGGIKYEDAITKLESEWNNDFSEEQASVIRKILNKKYNNEVEQIIKKMPSRIADLDEFKSLEDKLDQIEDLSKNTSINKIGYVPEKNSVIKNQFDEKMKQYKRYRDAIDHGVNIKQISFGAYKADNEPLGFQCDTVDGHDANIVLKIGPMTFKYDDNNKIGCSSNNIISWNSHMKLQQGSYNVNVTEKDTLSSDDKYYFGSIDIKPNDLIKLKNGVNIKRESGNYFIVLKGNK